VKTQCTTKQTLPSFRGKVTWSSCALDHPARATLGSDQQDQSWTIFTTRKHWLDFLSKFQYQKSLKAHMQRIHWQMLTQKIFSIVKNNQFQNLQWVKWQNTQLLVKRSANPFHKCIFVKRKIKNIRIFCLRAWKEEGLSNFF
jgi:hypothetical protein